MAAKKFLVDIDLQDNKLLNAVLDTTAGTTEGNVWYDSTAKTIVVHDGTDAREMGRVDSLASGTTAATWNHTDENIPSLSIADAIASGASGLLSGTDKQKLDDATDAATADKLVQRDASGRALFADPSGTGTQEAATATWVTSQISSALTGGVEVKGAYNASTGSPDLDSNSHIAYDVGDMYVVDTDGTAFHGVQLRAGDTLIATTARSAASSAQVVGDWAIIEKNQDIATDSVAGLLKTAAADGSTVNTGTATDEAITPSALASSDYIKGSQVEIVNDTTPQLGGDLDTNGHTIAESVGTAAVVATNNIPLVSDGNYFEVSGTGTVNTIDTAANHAIGTRVTLEFTSEITLSHNANIIMPNNGSSVATAANDKGTFVKTGATEWTCVSYTKADGQALNPGTSTKQHSELIGNGSLTDIVVDHSATFISQWANCQVVEVATLELVECVVDMTSTTTKTFTFNSAPASNAYRVIITG